MSLQFAVVPSPIGELGLLASEEGLRRVAFSHEIAPLLSEYPEAAHNPSSPMLAQAATELSEYFAGQRRRFTVPVDWEGAGGFRNRVQRLIAEIPFGKTASYGELAVAAGSPRAARAVGGACGTNPVPVVVPCHRVLSSDGRIGGYGRGFLGGLDIKRQLLALEGIEL